MDLGKAIEEANAEGLRRIGAGDPVLVDVCVAGEVLEDLDDYVVLHAGPPIEWRRMCGPMRGAVAGAIVYEGWAPDLAATEQLAESGEIRFQPNHHFGAVGPMTGIITQSMPVMVVQNRAFGNRAYSTIDEGRGNVMQFGGNDAEVVARLEWIAEVVRPALSAALRNREGIPLKSLIVRGLGTGDEMHMRNVACSMLILRELAPALARTSRDRETLPEILEFIAANDMFFVNIAMAMAKSVIAAAHGIGNSTIVTTMCWNGTEFGIRVNGTGDRWFVAPAEMPVGLLFPGYSESDADLDMGDSCIGETVGLGGFAMATLPAVTGFLGAGGAADALNHTRAIYEITVGRNADWTLPPLDFAGVPTGIDIRKVLETGVRSAINTAIAHRLPGLGQVRAGVVRAPQACFEPALEAFATIAGVQ